MAVVVGLSWWFGSGCRPGPTVWGRPEAAPGGGDAEVLLFALTTGTPGPLQVARRHGLPAGRSTDGLTVDGVAASERPAWIDHFSRPEVGLGAAVGGAPPPIGGAWIVRVRVADPQDLGHLQVAWAAARSAVEAGAFAVLDGYAMTWTVPADLPPVDAPFDPSLEVPVVCAPEPAPPFGHVCHTRGLRKLGRPDLILPGLGSTELGLGAVALRTHVGLLAVGYPLVVGDEVPWPNGEVGVVRAWVPGENAPTLELDADALVLEAPDRAP